MDDGLLEKCEKIFEPPCTDESDVVKVVVLQKNVKNFSYCDTMNCRT